MDTTFVVPAWIYHECLNPLATEFPREHPEIGKPTYRKRGFGGQYVYTVDTETRDMMLEHIRIFGGALEFGCDPETMYMARRMLRWLNAFEDKLRTAASR